MKENQNIQFIQRAPSGHLSSLGRLPILTLWRTATALRQLLRCYATTLLGYDDVYATFQFVWRSLRLPIDDQATRWDR